MSSPVKALPEIGMSSTKPVEGTDFFIVDILHPVDVNASYTWHGCKGSLGSGLGSDEGDMVLATHEEAVQDAIQTIEFMQSRPFNQPTVQRDYSIEEVNLDCFYWSSCGPTFSNVSGRQGPYTSNEEASQAAESSLTKAYEKQPSKFPIQKHHLVYEKHDVALEKELGLGSLSLQELDAEIAKRALADGLTKKQTFNMIATNSIEAGSLAHKQGSTKAHQYVSRIVDAAGSKKALLHKVGKTSGIEV